MTSAERGDQPLFIHRPTLQRGRGRIVFRMLTVLAWAIYLYLWLPLATLALWWGGGWLGLHELRRYPEFVDFDLFVVVAKAFVIALVLLLGWAEYNRRRFKGVDRRHPQPDLDPLDTARAMDCDPALARQLQQARRAVVGFDEQAVPQRVLAAIGRHEASRDMAGTAPAPPLPVA